MSELKEAIQDQIDTNLSLSLTLTELAGSLEVNPTYVSRTFARYFDDLSFGDYIRKLRIEKPYTCWIRRPTHSPKLPT